MDFEELYIEAYETLVHQFMVDHTADLEAAEAYAERHAYDFARCYVLDMVDMARKEGIRK